MLNPVDKANSPISIARHQKDSFAYYQINWQGHIFPIAFSPIHTSPNASRYKRTYSPTKVATNIPISFFFFPRFSPCKALLVLPFLCSVAHPFIRRVHVRTRTTPVGKVPNVWIVALLDIISPPPSLLFAFPCSKTFLSALSSVGHRRSPQVYRSCRTTSRRLLRIIGTFTRAVFSRLKFVRCFVASGSWSFGPVYAERCSKRLQRD